MVDAVTHAERIKGELRQAGATAFGMLKLANRYLPKIIGEDEHIHAVAYGRYSEEANNGTAWNWEEGTMVATDARVIFVDRKPGFLRADNIPYEMVAGVQTLKAWPFSSVTLMSRVGTFSLRYVKIGQADTFMNYVEERRQG